VGFPLLSLTREYAMAMAKLISKVISMVTFSNYKIDTFSNYYKFKSTHFLLESKSQV
jgi:hypothetical protein